MSDGISVGALYATLKLDRSAFEKGLQGSGVSLMGLAKTAVAAGAVIAGALVGFGIAAAKSAEEQERADDRVRRTLGKSGDAFIKWAGDNEIALRVTDDHLEQLGATAIQAFGSMGFSAAKSTTMVQSLMKRAADISATTGKSFDEVFEALLKGTEGATKGLKGLGIVVDQNAIKHEALRLGVWKGTGAISAAAKAAAIYSLEMKASANAAGAAAEKQGSMAEIAKTIPVVLDKIMDAAGRVFLPIVNAILPGVLAGFEALANGVESNVGAISGAVSGVGDVIGTIFSTVSSVISPLANAILPRLADAFGFITGTALPAIRSAFGTITTGILPAFQGYLDAITTNIIPALSDAFGALVTNALPVLQAAFNAIVTDVLPALSNGFDLLTTQVIPAIAGAIEWISTNILPPLSEAFTVIAQTIIPILAEAFNTVVNVIRDNWPTISSIAETVGNAVKTAVDAISVVIKAVAPVIKWLADTIFPILGAAAGVLLHVIDGAFKAIGVVWNAAWDIAKGIAKGIGDAFNALVGVFQAVGSAISGVFRGAMNFLIGIVNGIINAVDGIQVHIGKIGLDTPAGFIGVGPFDWNGLQIPNLKYLATGGVVTAPTLAMLGEGSKREAVIPLDDPRFQDLFKPGGGAQTVRNYNLSVQGNLQAKDEASVLRALKRLDELGEPG